MLARLSRLYGTRVRFLGIDVEDTRGDARAFERRHGITYPSIFDQHASLAAKLGFFGLPTAYVLDRNGRVAAVLTGRQQRRAVVERLDRLLREVRTG